MALKYDDIIDSIRLDEVLDALGVDVVKIRNGNHWGNCPIHDDRGEHFSIDEDTLVWNCFHCGGGVLPQLVIKAFGYDEDGKEGWHRAIEWLTPYSAGELADDDYAGFKKRMRQKLAKAEEIPERKRESDMPVFSERLLKDLVRVPDEYCEKWNVLPETMLAFRIGYYPERVRPSFRHDDYVGPAIVIPHFYKGQFVGYQERWLDNDRPKWVPKYTNSDDFPKTETLFNYDRAVSSGGYVIVVESVMTVIRLWELGYDAVATFGGSISLEQVRLLRNFEKIYLAFDNDDVGRKATQRCVEKLKGETVLKIVPAPDHEKGDLADLPEDVSVG